MASPGKTTQPHRNLSGKIPARALGSRTCSKLAALLQLLISELDSTNEITFQLDLICASLKSNLEQSFVSSRAITALSKFLVEEVHISNVISYFNKLQ